MTEDDFITLFPEDFALFEDDLSNRHFRRTASDLLAGLSGIVGPDTIGALLDRHATPVALDEAGARQQEEKGRDAQEELRQLCESCDLNPFHGVAIATRIPHRELSMWIYTAWLCWREFGGEQLARKAFDDSITVTSHASSVASSLAGFRKALTEGD